LPYPDLSIIQFTSERGAEKHELNTDNSYSL